MDIRARSSIRRFRAVVAVDDPAIEIVQIGGREAAAVQRHQGAQLGRNHRHDVQDHPFRPGAGLQEGLDQLKALHQLLALGFRSGLAQLIAHLDPLFLEFEGGEHLLHRLGADHRLEGILTVFLLGGEEFLFIQKLMHLQRRQAGLDHHEVLEIEHPL